jgi:hypothetical protein
MSLLLQFQLKSRASFRHNVVATATLAASSLALASAALAQTGGHGEESLNMTLVGHADLQARSSYQPLVKKQGDRYIAYVGHHDGTSMNPLTGQEETNGNSIVDVTDPANPVQLAHIPAVSGSQMMQVCNGDELPDADATKSYLLRTNGDDGHEIWDVTDPAKPTLLTTIIEGLEGTHKNWWDCESGIAYLVADLRPEGWAIDRGLKIYNLANPEEPVFIRNFGLLGDAPGQGGSRTTGGLHEATVLGDRVYLAYGVDTAGVVQILDKDRLINGNPATTAPFAPTDANLSYPIIGQLDMQPAWGGHTAWPLIGMEVPELQDFNVKTRDYLVVVSEATANGCQETIHHMAFFVDITDPGQPMVVSNYHVPEASGEFCERGGRFGTHASQWSYDPMFYKKVVFLSYFNAGARAVDVRDPLKPVELGYYIPATTDKTDERCDTTSGSEVCKIAIQTNNVELDDRGYLYLADRANTGLHIVEMTGPLKEIADAGPAPGPVTTGSIAPAPAANHESHSQP